jgi:hypothetical protein
MKIQLVKTNFGLKPVSDEDVKRLKKIGEGEIIEAEYKQQRNIRFHRKYFALIKLMWENDSLELTKERYRKEIELAAGYYDQYQGFDGEVRKEPKSISFAKMEEHEFNTLYQDMLQIACMRLGVDEGTIKEELKNILGGFF